MLWLFLGVGIALGVVLAYFVPAFLSTLLILPAIILTLMLAFTGGIERALPAIILLAVLSGFLFPSANYAQRSSKIAPRRSNKQKRKAQKESKTVHGVAAAQNAVLGSSAVEVPGYQVLEKVGAGGMASVYKARRKSDGQIVALKIPMEQYSADAKFIRRFHREAEVAQRLNHVNIVKTYEHGTEGVRHYMAMEFIDGRSLESYIEAADLNVDLSVSVMRLVVSALQHIHSAGIIHRDIKPANIMILRDSVENNQVATNGIKLMDFGIAGGRVLSRLTMTGARIGTPIYMSPEQARGLRIDPRSDIYSLGLVFYEMLTGQPAFKGGYEAIVHQQIFQNPTPPRQLNLSIPKRIDSLIMEMVAKDPEERPSLEEVLETLSGDYQSEPDDYLLNRIVTSVSSQQGVIRILDPEGSLHLSMVNLGMAKGELMAAPQSLTVDDGGNFYIIVLEMSTASDKNTMIHKLDSKGALLDSFGALGMNNGEFLQPIALSHGMGGIYVLDAETHKVQRFDNSGRFINSFGGQGAGKGTFKDPRVIKVDQQGLVYVLDYGNRQVQRFDANGNYQTRWAFKIGAGHEGMRVLDGLTLDKDNNLYISDATGNKIRKITPEGKAVQSYPIQSSQGEDRKMILDIGVDTEGNVYAARRGGHLIYKYNAQGQTIATLDAYAPIVQMIVDIDDGSR